MGAILSSIVCAARHPCDRRRSGPRADINPHPPLKPHTPTPPHCRCAPCRYFGGGAYPLGGPGHAAGPLGHPQAAQAQADYLRQHARYYEQGHADAKGAKVQSPPSPGPGAPPSPGGHHDSDSDAGGRSPKEGRAFSDSDSSDTDDAGQWRHAESCRYGRLNTERCPNAGVVGVHS